jgi:broad specificity phosphatase PhoE
MTDTASDEARQLLLAHVDRAVTGRLDDPALFAAVVGVERLVVATGSTDADVLRAALEGRLGEGLRADAPHGDAIASLVAEGERHVAAGLLRRANRQTVDAALVNPDAGAYEVTTDATLVRAAVRAAQRSLDAMPYYGVRYGERGSRFASTDSAWLVSLAHLGDERATRQVAWLSRVLAARGMPSWLMELHLVELVGELRQAAGDAAVGALPAAAEALTSARRRHVDDELLVQADGWAQDAVGDELPVPRAGALIAAATADVLTRTVHDDHALLDWLTDPARVRPEVAESLRWVRRQVRDSAR